MVTEEMLAGAVILVALTVGVLFAFKKFAKSRKEQAKSEEEPLYMSEVRQLAAQGDFRKAAVVQMRNGNKIEAFNLLVRGAHHPEASRLAEDLGQFNSAASHAEKAGAFDRAADLYMRCSEFGFAGRLYQRAGLFRKAAEAMEKDSSTDMDVLARMWRKACVKASTESRLVGDEAGQKDVLYCADKAATAYEIAGQDERAAFFYEMCNKTEDAERLRKQTRMFAESQNRAQAQMMKAAQPVYQAPAPVPFQTASNPVPQAQMMKSPGLQHPAPTPMPTDGVPTGTLTSKPQPPEITPNAYGSAVIDLKTINQFASAVFDHARRHGIGAPQQNPVLAPVNHEQNGGQAIRAEALIPTMGIDASKSSVHQRPLAFIKTQKKEVAPMRVAIEKSDLQSRKKSSKSAPRVVQDTAPLQNHTPKPVVSDAPTKVASDALTTVLIRDPLTGGETVLQRQGERYSVGESIGAGRIGVVYNGTDRLFKQSVALKFFPAMLTATPRSMECFEQGVRMAAAVEHPNLVTLMGHGIMGERPYMVMEKLEGQTLEHRLHACLREHVGMPIGEVLNIANAVLSGLEALHQRRLAHRDVRPINIMLTNEGQIKLMDVGIIRATDSKGGRIAGVTCYLANEVIGGSRGDHHSDLFAVGVMLYELLTGRLPFETRDREVMPQRPSFFRPDVPLGLDEMIWRCLQCQPKTRPESAHKALLILNSAITTQAESNQNRPAPMLHDNVIPLPSLSSHNSIPARPEARSMDG